MIVMLDHLLRLIKLHVLLVKRDSINLKMEDLRVKLIAVQVLSLLLTKVRVPSAFKANGKTKMINRVAINVKRECTTIRQAVSLNQTVNTVQWVPTTIKLEDHSAKLIVMLDHTFQMIKNY